MKNIELRCRNLIRHTYYWPWINISDFTQKDHLITVKIGPYQATLGSQELPYMSYTQMTQTFGFPHIWSKQDYNDLFSVLTDQAHGVEITYPDSCTWEDDHASFVQFTKFYDKISSDINSWEYVDVCTFPLTPVFSSTENKVNYFLPKDNIDDGNLAILRQEGFDFIFIGIPAFIEDNIEKEPNI